jgi:hypothetical protein
MSDMDRGRREGRKSTTPTFSVSGRKLPRIYLPGPSPQGARDAPVGCPLPWSSNHTCNEPPRRNQLFLLPAGVALRWAGGATGGRAPRNPPTNTIRLLFSPSM